MQDLFIEFLPPWVETGLQPAFYDRESGTVLQQTARMYAKVNELVKAVNGMDKVIKEYVDYIDNYFKNLDVQEEINNKLDDMAEGGELAEFIALYANLPCVHAYATIADMASSENLADGSYARAMSKTVAGTGDGAYYKIRETVEGDDPDGDNLVTITGTTLVAEKIPDANLNALELALNATIAKTQFVYETLGDMIADTEIGDGYTCKTLGKVSLNDGYGATYTIGETGDIALDNGLYATVQNNYGNNYYDEITISNGRTSDTDYYMATIPLNDDNGNLIPCYVAEVAEGTLTPLQYAEKNYTTITLNGGLGRQDSQSQWKQGAVISNGVILHGDECDTEAPEWYTYLGIKADRTLKNYPGTTSPENMLADGVQNAFMCFGQVVTNGVLTIDEHWDDSGNHPLVYIGTKTDGTMLIFACDGRTNHDVGLTIQDGASFMLSQGCTNAWRLDSGGSSSLVYKGSKQNRNIDENGTKDRGIWVTLNFKKDTIDKQLAEAYSFFGKERQLMNKQIRDDIYANSHLESSNDNFYNANTGYNIIANDELKVIEFSNILRHSTGIESLIEAGATRCSAFKVHLTGLVKVTLTATVKTANTAGPRTLRIASKGTETMPNIGCLLYEHMNPGGADEYHQISGTVVFNNATAGNEYCILGGGVNGDDFARIYAQIEYMGAVGD